MSELEFHRNKKEVYTAPQTSPETQKEHKDLYTDELSLDINKLSPLGKEALAITIRKAREKQTEASAPLHLDAYHSYTPSKNDEYDPNERLEPSIQIQPSVFQFSDTYEDEDLQERQLTANKRYTILELLGSGGFGTVYKARDEKTNEIVAIKYFSEDACQEAKAKGLAHSNITKILDEGQDEKGKFIVREHVEGRTLADIIAEHGKISSEQILEIFPQIISAVAYLHSKNIVHGDIKPQNVLICNETEIVKVTDFNLSKKIEGLEQSEKTKTFQGTLEWMAPEQIYKRKPSSKATDIYQLGKLMHLALTGEMKDIAEVDMLVLKSVEYSPSFVALANDCLNNNPENRPSIELLRYEYNKMIEKEYQENINNIFANISQHIEKITLENGESPLTRKLKTIAEWAFPLYAFKRAKEERKRLGEVGLYNGPEWLGYIPKSVFEKDTYGVIGTTFDGASLLATGIGLALGMPVFYGITLLMTSFPRIFHLPLTVKAFKQIQDSNKKTK